VGLADIGGGLYNENGFDVPKVIDWVYTQKKAAAGFPGRRRKDVCARRALSALRHRHSRGHRKSNHLPQCGPGAGRILCEGANGPTTWQADAIIDAKGIFTMPDILGNAGGVTVSYFEWVQDRQGFFWRESEVNERLLDVMDNAFDQVVRYAERTRSITASRPTCWPSTAWPAR
jgi:glutamate dehydrogenase (NAD(P)+)